MSATRLLVLGTVRIFQPVHGYDVRRELLSWQMDGWSNLQPGSIYSALKTLAKDGLIAVANQDAVATGPERTSYVLTGEGENEFQMMLRSAWWQVEKPAEPLMPALAFMLFLPREEFQAALRARATQLLATLDQLRFLRGTIADGATGAEGGIPEHVRENIDFLSARLKAELAWSKALAGRVARGAYTFAGDPGAPQLGPGRGWQRATQT